MLRVRSSVCGIGCGALLILAGCANTEYAGLNYATVIAPNGEEWKVISGKDQTNTSMEITRGDVVVKYTSAKEDATAPLTQAMKAQMDMVNNLVAQLIQALSVAKSGT